MGITGCQSNGQYTIFNSLWLNNGQNVAHSNMYKNPNAQSIQLEAKVQMSRQLKDFQ